MVTRTKSFIVKIEEAYCKGCGICVKFCPAKVLEMSYLKAIVAHPEKCVGCRACELRCPDFAFAVKEAKDNE